MTHSEKMNASAAAASQRAPALQTKDSAGAATVSEKKTRSDVMDFWIRAACVVYIAISPVLIFYTEHSCGAWGDSRSCKAPTAQTAQGAKSKPQETLSQMENARNSSARVEGQ